MSYTISSLWRYPVKSMAGEELEAVDVTARGLHGDRAYALVDGANGKVGSAKSVRKFGELLKCQARFARAPEPGSALPPVRIVLPDGTVIHSEQPDAQALLTAAFGPEVSLQSTAPDGLLLEFSAGTLGGKYAKTTEAPIAGGAPPGTFFDFACVHIVTSSTLERLKKEYPEGQFALQRFRPNMVVDCPGEAGFVENAWVGHSLAVGPELVVRVIMPCPRCVMTTLPRVDLPLDSGILRAAARLNTNDLGELGKLPCVGVYADVAKPGRISRRDAVRVSD